jgi:hypothetical protein
LQTRITEVVTSGPTAAFAAMMGLMGGLPAS